jgi:phosphoribosyl 1,2-cyclic phosphodiesterase
LITIKPLASSSKGNAYWITDGQTPLLLECGIPFRQIQIETGFQTSSIVGCLVTHEHLDHCRSTNDVMKAGIDCYLTKGTSEALGVTGHRAKVIEAKKQVKIGSWEVLPFEIQHDAAEPVGFLLVNQVDERLVYITDSYYCRYKFTGLSHVMIECNHSRDILNANVEAGIIPEAMKRRLIQSHMSLENVKEFLKVNDLSAVQEIILIHLSESNSDEVRFKREIMELTGKLVRIAQA